ncbi:putative mitochondrial hypothetical protein [Leptomonas pyrrhocoris]|uniref:Uncharacterized protein n=1 Tax=Leptomonas pyrrhocoris TaxID=157538 RepID=A0A0N0DV89_LEPPY|nr:putative mitochondrial hypothetical protein [Leptomonas pyrrhocoris]KPA80011.1 putative mitochondrial hypothetical protein [Leptomonas pyrrhocoris]|eukprot:XP_015658450.1 putative mitochondrial hypothetical protein [Leptomonas pyrrhocoris]
MFAHSRLHFPRAAVAYFNMKHFQVKYKANMNPGNAYATLTTSLMPHDRLLRHSSSGRGAGRVLVLDNKQKVKGVYIPVCCLPHPSAVTGDGNSLGVSVENYLKVIEPLAHLSDTNDRTTAVDKSTPMPTVLVVVGHPQGVAYGSFYADGRPALPLVNTDLNYVELTPVTKEGEDDNFGCARKRQVYRSRDFLMSVMGELQSMWDKDGEALSRCSTFYWITRDEGDALCLKSMRMCEQHAREDFLPEGVPTASPVAIPAGSHAVSFADRRWTVLPDSFFVSAGSRPLYTRDKTTQQRIVDPQGLQDAMRAGALLLDYVPRSVKNASTSAATMASESAQP